MKHFLRTILPGAVLGALLGYLTVQLVTLAALVLAPLL